MQGVEIILSDSLAISEGAGAADDDGGGDAGEVRTEGADGGNADADGNPDVGGSPDADGGAGHRAAALPPVHSKAPRLVWLLPELLRLRLPWWLYL